jgi:predicted transcriptional regulator
MLLNEIKDSWKWRIKRLKMTQKEFCDTIGISYGYFANMDNPTIKVLDNIETKLRDLESNK